MTCLGEGLDVLNAGPERDLAARPHNVPGLSPGESRHLFIDLLEPVPARRPGGLGRAPLILGGSDLVLEGQKVLIFTEFADTARYLSRQLQEAGIDGVAQVDSASKGNAPACEPASARIAPAMPNVPSTMSGASMFGNMCRSRSRVSS